MTTPAVRVTRPEAEVLDQMRETFLARRIIRSPGADHGRDDHRGLRRDALEDHAQSGGEGEVRPRDAERSHPQIVRAEASRACGQSDDRKSSGTWARREEAAW